MAEKINVSHITFRDESGKDRNPFLGPNEITHRGYTSVHFEAGMMILHWPEKAHVIMYPIDTIKFISSIEEEE